MRNTTRWYTLLGAGVRAEADEFYSKPEPEPEPDYLPRAGTARNCPGSVSLLQSLGFLSHHLPAEIEKYTVLSIYSLKQTRS